MVCPGADPGRGKIGHRGVPLLKNFFFRPEGYSINWNRIHSTYLEAWVMKWCCFWFHSEVWFLTLVKLMTKVLIALRWAISAHWGSSLKMGRNSKTITDSVIAFSIWMRMPGILVIVLTQVQLSHKECALLILKVKPLLVQKIMAHGLSFWKVQVKLQGQGQ